MNKISRIFDVKEKLACITLDFETDYGDRLGEFNILEKSEKDLIGLAEMFSRLDIPVSAFIRTDILTNYPKSSNVLKLLSKDFHCHSHTHNTKSRYFDSNKEIVSSALAFEEYFGYKPFGYRAPQGVLHKGDIDAIRDAGFKFSASVFPSYRPAKFNNLSMPVKPFMYNNGVFELPFAVIPKLRYTVSLSYLKLLGVNVSRALFSLFGIPNVIVFDSHLHDYLVNEDSFSKLPPHLKIAWGINKHSGIKCFKIFIDLLKRKNYRFITMTELYNYLKSM
jgi:hypothetical protein